MDLKAEMKKMALEAYSSGSRDAVLTLVDCVKEAGKIQQSFTVDEVLLMLQVSIDHDLIKEMAK